MNVCPECGAEVSLSMKFCPECGKRLEHGDTTISYAPSFLEEEEITTSQTTPENGASLVELDQVEGTAGRRLHDLTDSVVRVGRGSMCEIVLDDVTVSRTHAEVHRVDGEHGYRIRDVGSLNGTYVNRVRVDAVDLRNGDEIQIGKYRFKFVFN